MSASEITLSVVGVFAVLLVIVVVRLATRDRYIRGIRVGLFYERERDNDEHNEGKR